MFHDYARNWVVFRKSLVYACDFLMMCKAFLCAKKNLLTQIE